MTHMENLIPKDYPDFEEFGAPPCSETFPDAFFTEDKSTSEALRNGRTIELTHATYTYGKEAKAICADCPYKVRCLEYALKNHEQGIWGGTTERERTTIRRIMKTKPLANGRSQSK